MGTRLHTQVYKSRSRGFPRWGRPESGGPSDIAILPGASLRETYQSGETYNLVCMTPVEQALDERADVLTENSIHATAE